MIFILNKLMMKMIALMNKKIFKLNMKNLKRKKK